MNKQYVEGVQKQRKIMMDIKMVIVMLALLINGSTRDNISTVPVTEAKESKNFLYCHVTVDLLSNGYTHSPRETILISLQ